MNDGRKLRTNQVINNLSLGGFLSITWKWSSSFDTCIPKDDQEIGWQSGTIQVARETLSHVTNSISSTYIYVNLPERIYEKYEDVFNKCRVCSMSVAPPPRAKISGIRASVFGDVVFVDHCEIELKKKKYVVLLVLDGATNLLWATAQNSLDKKETLTHLRAWNEQNNCIPKAVVGDEAFFSDEFNEYYKFHGIKGLPCGPRTPWPNRAETAVRLFKKQWTIMAMLLEGDERFNGVTIRQAVKMTVWARNTQLTISGYSPLEIATGRRPPDLFDVETANPEQLTSEPPEEDISTLALQRLALRAHQEARQAADLRHDMARRTMPSDGPYKQGDEVFYWHQNSSKFKDKGRWIRGKVLSQEGAMVHLHTKKAVIRVNQSKVRRDHDEWHDVSIPNLDEAKEAIKDEGDLKREDHNLLCEGCLGEQAFWFYDDQKCDVLELFGSSSGYSWMMARKGVKAAQPIDHKHGSNLNTAYGQAEAWKKIVKMDPELIFINSPSIHLLSPHARWFFDFDVITWQCKRNKKFIVTCPEGSYFSLFLDQKRWHKILSKHLCWERVDLQHFCNCKDEIRNMIANHSCDDYQQDISWFEYLTKKMFFSHEVCWKDPHWKSLPARFLAGLMRATPEVSKSYVTDKRQEFLLEDILEDFDHGLLCGTCMHQERYDEHSLLLRDLDMRNDDIPVPLRHILPQKFSTPSLVSTLRMIEALPLGTEVSVRESTNEKIVALIPGLQNIRRMTLPQMYFESCSIFCGTYGRVNPLFSLPEDSVILLRNPGTYHRIFFMFMSQLYPHYKEFQVNKWNIIAVSTETSGAIRRTTVNPPMNTEVSSSTASTSWSGRKWSNSSGWLWSSTGRWWEHATWRCKWLGGTGWWQWLGYGWSKLGTSSKWTTTVSTTSSSVDASVDAICCNSNSTRTNVFESWWNSWASHATCCWWRIKFGRTSPDWARKSWIEAERNIAWFWWEATKGKG